jgi:uncharacterized protein (TIGR00297 family)
MASVKGSRGQDRSADREDWRQIEHLAPLLFAFLLPYISFAVAILLCGLAAVYGAYVSPRLFPGTMRAAERRDTFSRAKLAYALSVAALLVVFRERLHFAAAVWAILAAGDSFSSVLGRRFGRGPLPYNERKTLLGFASFWLFGTLAAWILFTWNLPASSPFAPGHALTLCAVCALLCAVSESLPSVIDDNIMICWVGCGAMLILGTIDSPLPQPAMSPVAGLALNGGVGALALALGWISIGGAVAALILGLVVCLGLGWQAFLCIVVFLAAGSVATRLGRGRKSELGVAQPNRGRRGVGNVVANGAIPGVLALAGLWVESLPLAVAYASAVATAAFDSAATEIGQWLGKRPVSPWTRKRVAVGTPGAVSAPGVLAGAAAAGLVAATCRAGDWLPLQVLPIVVASALIAGLTESVVASAKGRESRAAGHSLNLFNTLLGASLGGYLAWLAG